MAKFFEVDPKNFRFFKYSNGRLAIRQLSQDGDPVATLTVNLPELDLEERQVFIKSYSENEGLLEDPKELGLVEVVDTVTSEYVTIPKCR
jgi:hypothetical protein